MAVPVRSQSFHDPMADSRRRRVWSWRIFKFSGAFILILSAIWLVYWSPVFAVNEVVVSGVNSIDDDAISDAVHDLLDQKKLYVFQPHRSIVFLSADAVSTYLLDKYPSIAEVSIKKDYPHTLIVAISERHAIGQWCHEGECQLFDNKGSHWGSTLPSSGPLLLLVQDERQDGEFDTDILQGIMTAVDGLPELSIFPRKVILPDAEPGGIQITSNVNYGLYMNALGDVVDQLSVLSVFLADRAKDPSFSPQYIDLRTPGRVYYK